MTTPHNTRIDNLGKLEVLPLTANDVARYWAKVERKGDEDCWEWKASRTGSLGYGQFCYQAAPGRQAHAYAHRVAYQLEHGSIPVGAHILHDCDNPLCCNASHLKAGTHKANMEDAQRRGRLHAPRPTAQKLTDTECDTIVALVTAGQKAVRLAERYGVSKAYVSRLMRGTLRQYRKGA